MKKLPIVAIIGRPNIGKSTLFNLLVGRNKAIVSNVAGTTRDRIYEYVEWFGHEFILVDTAGIEDPQTGEIIEIAMQKQVKLAIDQADIILFGVDGQTMFFPEDREILNHLWKSKKPFFLFVNKVDNDRLDIAAHNSFENIDDNIHYISAKNGRGVDDFFDAIVASFELLPQKSLHYALRKVDIQVALVGKPNVGKSSLINVFTNDDTAIVSNVAGTTRDTIHTDITFHKTTIRLLDTAGIRRKTKVKDTIEKFSVLRSLKAIEISDIVLLIIDATEPVSKQDMTLSRIALEQGKSIILVVNKWDLVEKDAHTHHEYEMYLRKIFGYMKWVPILFTSATEKIRTFKLLEYISDIKESRFISISTSKLNTVIKKLIMNKPPQARHRKIKHPKIYYATQTGSNPPQITFFVNDKGYFHNSYKRYLHRGIQDAFNLFGTPVQLVFRNRDE